jgi:hypothetical protein
MFQRDRTSIKGDGCDISSKHRQSTADEVWNGKKQFPKHERASRAESGLALYTLTFSHRLKALFHSLDAPPPSAERLARATTGVWGDASILQSLESARDDVETDQWKGDRHCLAIRSADVVVKS